MTVRRQAEYKQMAFETAIRNPERYFSILKALMPFEGLVLNDENLLTIVAELYRSGLVGSGGVDVNQADDELKEQIKEVNSTRNGDGGFPKGYASRFWTYMRTPSEFGLVYARYNKVFKISPLVKKVIDGELDEQEAFALQAFKGNRRSPYRNVSNDYNFFKFIFRILKARQESGHSLSMEQFTLAMFSRDGNVDEFIDVVQSNKFSGPETVYSYLKTKYGASNRIKTVTRDYPDVVIRMLLITGMISIRYTGIKLIELNKNKIDFFTDLAKVTPALSDSAKRDDMIFFDEMNSGLEKYNELLVSAREVDVITGSEYTNKLLGLIDQYSLTQVSIVSELKRLCGGRGVTDLFKEMPDPLKLEFYTSLLVASVYGDTLEIRPNYKTDHEGKPYSHAPGGGGDIDVFTDNLYWLIEVTLIQNRQQQYNHETTNVVRHITSSQEFKDKMHKYLSFVAPRVHQDTQEFFEYATYKYKDKGIKLGTYSIDNFISTTLEKNNFSDMSSQTKSALKNVT